MATTSSSPQSLASKFRRIKPADVLTAEGDHGGLKRSMGLIALTMFSVGSIVGTGIFVILGEAVPKAGPAVLISFVLAAVVCAFSALSYAELAGSIPVSGSSYSYTYATLGELVAWIVGWCLMLEYGVSVAAVAVGWGQYLNEFLSTFGLEIPAQFANPPGEAGGVFNIPAVIVVVLCAFLLLRGASESAKVNTIMVFLKIGILLFFCAIAFTAFEPGNFKPFLPLGAAGISAAAGQVFFSYIGFDAASTAGEEAKNAKRDLPRAIIASLVIVTILYVLVAAAAIGARGGQPDQWEGANSEAVLAGIAREVTGSSWAPTIIALGAVISIFSVVLVVMYGQTRILFAMGRDGLLPKVFTKVNPKTQTPVNNTIIVAVVISILAAFVPLGQLAEATSIGTLAAFAVVNVGVITLWLSRPDLERTFKVPLLPLFPIIGVVFCLWLIAALDIVTWIVFFAWLLLGLLVYFFYGLKHSNVSSDAPNDVPAAVAAKDLPTRNISVGSIIGAVILVVLAVVSFSKAFSEGMGAVKMVIWIVMGLVALAGIAYVVIGLRQESAGRAEVAAGKSADGAAAMRGGTNRITAALLIPGILFVLAMTFATSTRAAEEKANQEAGGQVTTSSQLLP
ncbi:MAG: amino acid permease [Actinobacteria bacterium]|nr:MAG: amino acid permease [Actinomycetota bacterium]